MRHISRDELASLIDVDRLRNIVSDRVNLLPFGKCDVEEEDDMKSFGQIIKVTVTVMLVVGVICAAAYGVYRFLNRRYDDDFDEFDDSFDDDYYFDDEDLEDEFEEEDDEEAVETPAETSAE